MRIYKQAENSNLFQVQEIPIEQLIALNDVTKNYREYIQKLLKLSDQELAEVAPGEPKQVRQSIRLQILTCSDYETAFNEILAKSKKPLQN